jgi:hypothetical protein
MNTHAVNIKYKIHPVAEVSPVYNPFLKKILIHLTAARESQLLSMQIPPLNGPNIYANFYANPRHTSTKKLSFHPTVSPSNMINLNRNQPIPFLCRNKKKCKNKRI